MIRHWLIFSIIASSSALVIGATHSVSYSNWNSPGVCRTNSDCANFTAIVDSAEQGNNSSNVTRPYICCGLELDHDYSSSGAYNDNAWATTDAPVEDGYCCIPGEMSALAIALTLLGLGVALACIVGVVTFCCKFNTFMQRLGQMVNPRRPDGDQLQTMAALKILSSNDRQQAPTQPFPSAPPAFNQYGTQYGGFSASPQFASYQPMATTSDAFANAAKSDSFQPIPPTYLQATQDKC